MSVRKVLIYGNPILRLKAQPVTDFGPKLKELVQDMLDTVAVEDGVGLAAPQIGESLRVIVLYLRPENQDPFFLPIVNPEFLESGGGCDFEEGVFIGA